MKGNDEMAYAYTIIAEYEDAVITVETNDVEVAILSLAEHINAVSTTVVDGFTGEVLAYRSIEFDPYFEPAFGLACLGYIAKEVMGM